MGAYLEARVFGVTNCYCFSPGGAQRYGAGDAGAVLEKLSDLQFAKWKVAVKAAAEVAPVQVVRESSFRFRCPNSRAPEGRGRRGRCSTT
jgi:hypothetical protein